MRRLEDFSSRRQRAGDGPIEECWWDVITENVLPRLPGKVLLTFKTVCKNWSRIISSPYFVGLHLNLYNRTRILVQTTDDYSKMIEYNHYYEETKHVLIPPAIRTGPEIIPTKTQILGSCDGLLCLLLDRIQIAMYNPSTGKYSRVQHSPRGPHICSPWFGRHPSSGEYVLILGDCFGHEVSVHKFSRDTRMEKIHSTVFPPYCCYAGRGTFLHGALHWPNVNLDVRSTCGIIIAYHLEDNKIREILGPRGGTSHFKLGVNAEGCLFAVVGGPIEGEFEMWIMKEYGVEQSWAKYASIGIGIGIDGYKVPSPLRFFPNGDLVLDVNNSKLMKYNFNDRKAKLLMNHNCFSQVIMCADTLVSPAIGQ